MRTSNDIDPPESHREISIAFACTAAAILCFSGVPVVLRHLTEYLDSWTVNAVRYSTAALFWLPYVLLRGWRANPDGRQPAARSIWVAALLPTVFNLAGQIGWAMCPYYAEASTIGFAVRISFLFTVLFGILMLPSERALARSPLFALGAAVSVGGIVVMYFQKLSTNGWGVGTGAIGMAIVLGTTACWGAYAVSVRRCLRGYPLRLAFGVVSVYTAACLVALMLLFGDYGRLGGLVGREWALMICSGLLAIGFGHVLLYRGIQVIGPLITSGMGMLHPFFVYLAAAVFLGERLTGKEWVGGITIVAGGLILIKAKARLLAAQRSAALRSVC